MGGMALVDSTPQQARPFLGDAPRRARTAGAAGATLRREAVATLTASLARPGRFARQIASLVAANIGVSLLASALFPPAGAALARPGLVVLTGLVLVAAGVLLAVGPVVEGQRTTRALQAWLAPGAADRSRVPSLTDLLRPVGLVRLLGCGLLVIGILAGLVTGFGVLGGSGGTGGVVLVGASGPAALVGTLPAVVTVVLAAIATLRLQSGRRGRAPQEDAGERAAVFAPGPGGAPGGFSTPRAPGGDAAAVPWGTGAAPVAPVAPTTAPPDPGTPAPAWNGTAAATPSGPLWPSVPSEDLSVAAPVPPAPPAPPPAAVPAAPPAVVTGVPVLGRPAPLAPGGAHPLPATTTEPGPVPGWTTPPAEPSTELPEATIVRTDLPEHTVARPDLLRPRRLAVVVDDGVAPVALAPGSWLLGRAPSARPGEDGLLPLVVEDGSVSKTHLLVEVAEHAVSVTDRASSNGTHLRWAGGRRRLAAWRSTAVAAGASVEVGAITIRVETAAEPSE